MLAAASVARSALAGPPWVTDDPEPTPTGQFENYAFVQGSRVGGTLGAPAAGAEINYGALPDTQVSFSFPVNPDPGPDSYGMVWIPLGGGVKYRFIEEDDDGWRPQVAVFPQISVPVGPNQHGEPVNWLFPLWAQKTVGRFTAFGGGGYTLNPGVDNRDYLSWGVGLADQVTKIFQIGPEVFGVSRTSVTDGASNAVGLGAIYDFSDNWHIVGSANTAVDNRKEDDFSFNFALKWTG